MYEIENKPRIYKDIKFRSTLETSWAIMFDKLGWSWRYEPFRLDGWVPDFLLNSNILVEVKPNNELSQFHEYNKYDSSTTETRFNNAEILLLGESPIERGDVHDSPAIGWLIERPHDQRSHAIIWHTELGYGFANDCSNWRCRITGAYKGGSGIIGPEWQNIRQMWFNSCSEARLLQECKIPDWPNNRA